MFHITGKVWRIGCHCRNTHQNLNVQSVGYGKLASSVLTFIVKCRKILVTRNRLCPGQHLSHGLAVVFVGYFVINGYVVLIVNCSLHIIGNFGDLVAGN